MVTTLSSPVRTNALPETTAHRQRGPQQPQQWKSAAPGVNVGQTERLFSAAGGLLLGLWGLTHRDTLVGLGAAAVGGSLLYRGLTGHCYGYQALGLNTAETTGAAVRGYRGFKVTQAMTINRPASELYQFWRNFENLPHFMSHLASVKVEGNRSHWVAHGPLGTPVSWDAEVINERPNELIAWQTVPGSLVASAGSVHFRPAPGGRGTEVHVTLKYDPPGGALASWFTWLVGKDPASMVREDLRRFKQLMEAGEVPTIQGQPSCRH